MYEIAIPWVIGAALSGMILTIEHLTLWRVRLKPVVRYTLGVAALHIGATLALVMQGGWAAAVGLWGIAGIGGAVVASLHLWREQRNEQPGELEDSFEAGRLAARAREDRRVETRER